MTEILSAAAWFDLVAQFLTISFGGSLVIFTNWIFERRRDRREEELRFTKEQSILVGINSVRNLLATELRVAEGEAFSRDKLPVLHAAQRNLHSLLDLSEPSSQGFVSAIFEIRLRLDVLISVMETEANELNEENSRFAEAFNGVIEAIEMFDITAFSSLEFLSEEELSRFTQPAGPAGSRGDHQNT